MFGLVGKIRPDHAADCSQRKSRIAVAADEPEGHQPHRKARGGGDLLELA
jgi:hypothetical protein